MGATSTTHDSIEFKKTKSPKYKINISNCDRLVSSSDAESSESDDSELEQSGQKFRSQIVGMTKPLELPIVTQADSELRSQSTHFSSGHDECLSDSHNLSDKVKQLRNPSTTSDGSRYSSSCSSLNTGSQDENLDV